MIIMVFSISRSLELNASVTNKKGIPTKYKYKVNKLPGELNPDKCTAEVMKIHQAHVIYYPSTPMFIYESHGEKTSLQVSDQVGHKTGCIFKENG